MSDCYWMHLTDLHVGMAGQEWQWPHLKNLFFDDLERQAKRVSQIKFVLFSGDFVQKGKKEEYQKFNGVLIEIWDKLKELGADPSLIHIPGNHDLLRPDDQEPVFLTLANYWDLKGVRENFFEGKYGYSQSICDLFENYIDWSSGITKETGIIVPPRLDGILPGDKSVRIECDTISIGIVGLNSTWLQFGEGDRQGKLAVEPKQILAVTGDDISRWCAQNDFNILTTHHPTDWLHSKNQSIWNTDVSPSGKFDIHVYGHMHEAKSASVSTYGSKSRHSMQGASLFGLQYLADHTTERLFGYSISQISVEQDQLSVHVWPRTLRRLGSGDLAVQPNRDFDLNEDNSYLALKKDHIAGGVKKKAISAAK